MTLQADYRPTMFHKHPCEALDSASSSNQRQLAEKGGCGGGSGWVGGGGS